MMEVIIVFICLDEDTVKIDTSGDLGTGWTTTDLMEMVRL